jgi:hypothetical protein
LNERETRITDAATVRSEKIVRSTGLPSSKAWTALPYESPSHIDGVRDPRKNNQITGTHNAAEVLGTRAGSKQKRPKRRTPQKNSAKEGAIVLL